MTGHVKQIAVTGAAGQICYSLLFRIARGELYGPRQPISLRLLDLPQVQPALRGVVMELEDCAFPLLADVAVTDDARLAFHDIDAAILVGSRPRSKGMERRDLLATNAEIFRLQGRALNDVAKPDAKVLVVGNPANTNAMILSEHAPEFPSENITSMIRLDQNRALAQLARKARVCLDEIKRLVVWGNHSPTMFADCLMRRSRAACSPTSLLMTTGIAALWFPRSPTAGQPLSTRAAPPPRPRPRTPPSIICATGSMAAAATGPRWDYARTALTEFLKVSFVAVPLFARMDGTSAWPTWTSKDSRAQCWIEPLRSSWKSATPSAPS